MTNLYFAGTPSAGPAPPTGFTIPELAQQHVGRKLGMFYHFSMATYTLFENGDEHADPDTFAPTDLSYAQWMDVAQNAGAAYVVSVMKHHDGFTQWDSAVQPYNSTLSASVAGRELLAEFAEEANSRNLPHLHYLSVRDRRWEYDHPGYTSEQYTQFTMDILTEMYERCPNMFAFWLDSWSPYTLTTLEMVDYTTVREHIRSLRSNLLLLRNDNGDTSLTYSDMSVWEMPSIGPAPPTNLLSAESCTVSQSSWFWHPGTYAPSSGTWQAIAEQVWRGNSALLLNAGPERDGLIQQDVIDSIGVINTD